MAQTKESIEIELLSISERGSGPKPTQYIKVPLTLRREHDTTGRDMISVRRFSDDGEVFLRVVKHSTTAQPATQERG